MPPKRDLQGVIAAVKKKGYPIFVRPYELNMVGIRDENVQADSFDDQMWVFWKDEKAKWQHRTYRITTDPGKIYLQNGLSGKKDISILAEGQWINAYALGMHKKQYKALVQVKDVTALLDGDGNSVLNFKSTRKKTGKFGLNIHRAKKAGTTEDVYLYSAGCQVFANAADFDAFMALCEKHKAKYGNAFTYTLIDEKAAKVAKRKVMLVRTLITMAALLVLASVVYVLYRRGILQAGLSAIKKGTKQLQTHESPSGHFFN